VSMCGKFIAPESFVDRVLLEQFRFHFLNCESKSDFVFRHIIEGCHIHCILVN
jgi:hypothetical protein